MLQEESCLLSGLLAVHRDPVACDGASNASCNGPACDDRATRPESPRESRRIGFAREWLTIFLFPSHTPAPPRSPSPMPSPLTRQDASVDLSSEANSQDTSPGSPALGSTPASSASSSASRNKKRSKARNRKNKNKSSSDSEPDTSSDAGSATTSSSSSSRRRSKKKNKTSHARILAGTQAENLGELSTSPLLPMLESNSDNTALAAEDVRIHAKTGSKCWALFLAPVLAEQRDGKDYVTQQCSLYVPQLSALSLPGQYCLADPLRTFSQLLRKGDSPPRLLLDRHLQRSHQEQVCLSQSGERSTTPDRRRRDRRSPLPLARGACTGFLFSSSHSLLLIISCRLQEIHTLLARWFAENGRAFNLIHDKHVRWVPLSWFNLVVSALSPYMDTRGSRKARVCVREAIAQHREDARAQRAARRADKEGLGQ